MPSASCCFLHVFYIAGNQYQTESKRSESFCGFFWTRRHPVGRRSTWGCSEVSTRHQGTPGGPSVPWWVVPTSVASRTASLLYEYLDAPETLRESTKFYSSFRKFQNHEIQSRALFRHSAGGEHDLGGVHHPHWCLFDDV